MSWSLAQQFVQVYIKNNIKALCHWPLWGESTGDQWIPLTKGNVSISWSHHVWACYFTGIVFLVMTMKWSEMTKESKWWGIVFRAVSRFVPSQWEMTLLCNDVSHLLGASLESVLVLFPPVKMKHNTSIKSFSSAVKHPQELIMWPQQNKAQHDMHIWWDILYTTHGYLVIFLWGTVNSAAMFVNYTILCQEYLHDVHRESDITWDRAQPMWYC